MSENLITYRCDECFDNLEHPCFLLTDEDDSDEPKNCPYGGYKASWIKEERKKEIKNE